MPSGLRWYVRKPIWAMGQAELKSGVALHWAVRPRANVAPPAGFEPATFRLEGGCSVR